MSCNDTTANLSSLTKNELATRYASCPCAGPTCSACQPIFDALYAKQAVYLLRAIESLNVVRLHAPPLGPLHAGQIADRIWQHFQETRREWLSHKGKAQRTPSFGQYLAGNVRRQIMDEFVGESIKRHRVKAGSKGRDAVDPQANASGRVWSQCSSGHLRSCDDSSADLAGVVELVHELSKACKPDMQTAIELIYKHGASDELAAKMTSVPKTTLISRLNALGNKVAQRLSAGPKSQTIEYLLRNRRGRKPASGCPASELAIAA
jgi:DNA-directed RNA polymerase specialized sigma24 family protein